MGRIVEQTHRDADGVPRTTCGRCVALWGDGPYLRLVLEHDDGVLTMVAATQWDALRVVADSPAATRP